MESSCTHCESSFIATSYVHVHAHQQLWEGCGYWMHGSFLPDPWQNLARDVAQRSASFSALCVCVCVCVGGGGGGDVGVGIVSSGLVFVM